MYFGNRGQMNWLVFSGVSYQKKKRFLYTEYTQYSRM